ncbi:MAG TPA: hypothetical protein VF158_05840 [Longimicrobiales bacterium]
MSWFIVACVATFAIGIYIGLGYPGLPGREDRVVHRRPRRVHRFTPLDLLRRPRR